jgi:hypothetical protein
VHQQHLRYVYPLKSCRRCGRINADVLLLAGILSLTFPAMVVAMGQVGACKFPSQNHKVTTKLIPYFSRLLRRSKSDSLGDDILLRARDQTAYLGGNRSYVLNPLATPFTLQYTNALLEQRSSPSRPKSSSPTRPRPGFHTSLSVMFCARRLRSHRHLSIGLRSLAHRSRIMRRVLGRSCRPGCQTR